MLNEKDILKAKYEMKANVNRTIANVFEVISENDSVSPELLNKLDDKLGHLEFRIECAFDSLLGIINEKNKEINK